MNSYIYVSHGGNSKEKTAIAPDTRLCDIAPEIAPDAVCAYMNGCIVSLADTAKAGARVQFLSPFTDELASRVFLRGAVFLLFCAAHALYPERTLIVEHMLCGGVYCTLGPINDNIILALEEKIAEYVAEDNDFVPSVVSAEEAKAVFLQQGMTHKAELLTYRSIERCRLYTFDGLRDHFFGVMPKSAGYLEPMRLEAYADGFILKYPAPYRQPKTPIVRQGKYAAVFRQAEKWAGVLGVSYVADLNRMLSRGEIADFIRVNEALHEKTIADIAAKIVGRPDANIVLVAGPSSSGKTTFASRLAVHLRVLGKKCRPISLDNYYKNRADIPCDTDGRPDFECLAALDTTQLNSDLKKLIRGETVNLPMFDFVTGKRSPQTEAVQLDGEILILEGIHGLNDALTQDISASHKFKIFISPLTTLNLDNHNVIVPEDLRLLRRLVRDRRTRAYAFEHTIAAWDSVRRGEFLHILPYQETADMMFNSTLIYEPLILKKHCIGELRKISPDMPCHARAGELIKILNYFLSAEDESEIPTRSILREFIGTNG